jgi:hypothetical protein
MWTKAMIGGVVSAALLGTGGLAVAAAQGTTQASTTTPRATSTATATTAPTSSKAGGKKPHDTKGTHAAHLKNLQHGEWVTQDKTGAFVTHTAIRGAVTAVSPTSVTVKDEDGVSMTFAVTADTTVRVRADGGAAQKKAADAKISDVKAGQQAVVMGTGKGSLSANRILVTTG